MRRNALDTLTDQQWRTIGIEVAATTQRTYRREALLDDALHRGAVLGHPSRCGGCDPGGRSRPGVIWSDVMKARVP